MNPAPYRKLPLTFMAMPFDGGQDAASHVIDWILANGGTARWHEAAPADGTLNRPRPVPEYIAVDTLEGTMRAWQGWWIIREITGEFYTCDPAVFAKTYEYAGEIRNVGEIR